MSDKVVLAYSGGLDTSVAIKWLKEKYDLDVIALTVDVGNVGLRYKRGLRFAPSVVRNRSKPTVWRKRKIVNEPYTKSFSQGCR